MAGMFSSACWPDLGCTDWEVVGVGIPLGTWSYRDIVKSETLRQQRWSRPAKRTKSKGTAYLGGSDGRDPRCGAWFGVTNDKKRIPSGWVKE